MKIVDVLIIGAGQAGMALAYYLQQSGQDYVLVEANPRVGDSWRKRYDSLVLFTPRRYCNLPGMDFPGEPNTFPTKDEAADYLERYVASFDLPVMLNTKVNQLHKEKDYFIATTTQGEIAARKVVVATGPFQKPYIPAFSAEIERNVFQTHSSAYIHPDQLQKGNVLVVGGGNSGAQIAVELQKTREVAISLSTNPAFKPLVIGGKSIFWFFDKLGLIQADIHSWRGKWLRSQPEQIYGLELKSLIHEKKITVFPKATSSSGRTLHFENSTHMKVDNIVWATGFRLDYSWLNIPEALDLEGKPRHERGVSPVRNLYYIGLPWQNRRGSALLGWVGLDAKQLVDELLL